MGTEFFGDDLNRAAASAFERTLEGYHLTLAEILYHLPDHPSLLQSFVWQDLDIAPKFPVLHKFLEFWEENIEGELHSVRVDSAKLITPPDFRVVSQNFSIH